MGNDLTQVLASHFHTPSDASHRVFHTVLRAGHIQAGPDYGVERPSYPGHDLLMCVGGAGFVRSNDRVYPVAVGQLAWIDCHQPHAHWANRAQPWELLWMRIDAHQTRLFAKELGIREMPVFSLRDTEAAVSSFQRVFMLLTERPLAIDAALHAAVVSLIALLFEARQLGGERGPPSANPDLALHTVLANMRANHRSHWSVRTLAQLSGLSMPHFFRRFRKATGSSPIDWLRRERMNHAKRRLTESSDLIRDIAEQVGYSDPFYFSRDFKKLVGMSPKHYRVQEQAKGIIQSSSRERRL